MTGSKSLHLTIAVEPRTIEAWFDLIGHRGMESHEPRHQGL